MSEVNDFERMMIDGLVSLKKKSSSDQQSSVDIDAWMSNSSSQEDMMFPPSNDRKTEDITDAEMGNLTSIATGNNQVLQDQSRMESNDIIKSSSQDFQSIPPFEIQKSFQIDNSFSNKPAPLIIPNVNHHQDDSQKELDHQHHQSKRFHSAPAEKISPFSPYKHRKGVPRRSIKSPTSVQEKMIEKIIQLNFSLNDPIVAHQQQRTSSFSSAVSANSYSSDQDDAAAATTANRKLSSAASLESEPSPQSAPAMKSEDAGSLSEYMHAFLNYHRAKFQNMNLRRKKRHERIISQIDKAMEGTKFNYSTQIELLGLSRIQKIRRRQEVRARTGFSNDSVSPMIRSAPTTPRKTVSVKPKSSKTNTGTTKPASSKPKGSSSSSSSGTRRVFSQRTNSLSRFDNLKGHVSSDFEIPTTMTEKEKAFAQENRLKDAHYLDLKRQMAYTFHKYGYFNKTAARRHVRGVDVVRLGKVWEFMNEIGVIYRSE